MDDDIGSRLDTIESLLVKHLAARNVRNEAAGHWHVKKEVTVAHILSTFGVLGLLVTSWFTLSATVNAIDLRTTDITEARVSGVEQHVNTLDDYMREEVGAINTSLSDIDDKLSDLSERTVENRK